MFQTIVVGIDGSKAGAHALEIALELAKATGDGVVLCHALDPASLVALAGYEAPYPADAVESLRQAAMQTLADALAAAKANGVAAASELLEGDPTDAILRCARNHHAGLIAMGTHGRGGIKRLLLGSVAEGVLRRATVPVMTVRERND